jgi:hypothetical protein
VRTEDLITQLSADLRPIRRGAVERRLVIGGALGALLSALLVMFWIGVRPDLGVAIYGYEFWVKFGYTLSLALASLVVAAQLARPGHNRVRGLWLIVVPVALLTCVGLAELAQTPRSDWLEMWLGHSWISCPWLVLVLAMPIAAGLFWSLRRLAPTRLRSAGAAAGLTAGAFAATLYCLHCPEASAMFVLTWYSLGIALAASLGALVAPRLLHW